jgi:galactose mutarotase-like enzyme
MTEISKSTWHDLPAFTLESEAIRVVIVPDLGAKIVSLYDKTHRREWLVPPIRPVKQTLYGSVFVDQDMCGWDEMLPTITVCDWEGAHLPDHGEVWSIPWQLENTDGALTLSVEGTAIPYHFVRSASFLSPDTLELRYSLVNTGQKELPYLWAAHPQFAAGPETRIILPPDVTQVVNVIEDDPVLGKAGELCTWPEAASISGQAWRLDQVRSVGNHTCRKVYTLPEQPVSWAALVDKELGCQLHLAWPTDFSPYLGIWIDEGMYNTAPVAALEPANGYYDGLERAIQNQKFTSLAPGHEATWSMKICLGAA